MTDKKLTDSEIVKALECCCVEHACSKCPYAENNSCGCINGILKDALDYINRLETENERLNNNISAMAITLRNSAKETKAEARKEFAERLKEKHKHNKTSVVSLVTVFDNINNLLKEMESEGT